MLQLFNRIGENDMIQNVSIAVRLVNIYFDKVANTLLAPYDLSHAQFKVMILLYSRPQFTIRQVDIEDFFQISNPTVTEILRALERKGLIERRVNPEDIRSKLIGTTEKAEAMRDDIAKVEKELSEQISASLTEDEKMELLILLNKIIGNELPPDEQYKYRESEVLSK